MKPKKFNNKMMLVPILDAIKAYRISYTVMFTLTYYWMNL